MKRCSHNQIDENGQPFTGAERNVELVSDQSSSREEDETRSGVVADSGSEECPLPDGRGSDYAQTSGDDHLETSGKTADVARRELSRLPDADLLESFSQTRSEAVFNVIVARHAPLVLAVCRRSISDEHLAEDAFQATFMVLAKRAGRIKKQESLASWLYGTAWRISLQTLKTRLKRREQEIIDPVMVSTDPLQQVAERFEQQVVDEELADLPPEYRSAVVMHDVLGKPCSEIAQELGVTTGTVEGNLKRGRRQLRMRLARRGISLSIAAALITGTLKSVEASASTTLLNATVAASVSYAGGTSAVATSVSTASTQLAAQELALMTITKSLIGSFVLTASIVTAVGVWSAATSQGDGIRPGAGAPSSAIDAIVQDEGEDAGFSGGLGAAGGGDAGVGEDDYGDAGAAGYGSGGGGLEDEAGGYGGLGSGGFGSMAGGPGAGMSGGMEMMEGAMEDSDYGDDPMGGMMGMGSGMGMEDMGMYGGGTPGMGRGSSGLPPSGAFVTSGRGRSGAQIGAADFGSVNKANKTIQRALDAQAPNLDFPGEVPLSDVLAAVQRHVMEQGQPTPILMDRAALGMSSITSLDQITVTDIQLQDMTLRSTLKLILEETDNPAVTFVVRDEALVITTVEAANQLRAVEFYDLTGFMQPGNEAGLRWVEQTIRTLINDESAQWTESGGAAGIVLYPRGLIITQSPKVHERIADLLQRLEQQMAPIQGSAYGAGAMGAPGMGMAGGMMGGMPGSMGAGGMAPGMMGAAGGAMGSMSGRAGAATGRNAPTQTPAAGTSAEDDAASGVPTQPSRRGNRVNSGPGSNLGGASTEDGTANEQTPDRRSRRRQNSGSGSGASRGGGGAGFF